MSVLARWVISPRLMGVPGVANVTVWGFRDRQLQVLVDPQRLRENNDDARAGHGDRRKCAGGVAAHIPGGVHPRHRRVHRHGQPTAQHLPRAGHHNGRRAGSGTRLEGRPAAARPRRSATWQPSWRNHQPLIGDAVCAGGEQCLFLVVEKFPDANTVEVTEGVDAALDAMRPGLGDMRIDSSLYRPASYIESSFEHLGWALLAGVLLMLIVIGTLFWDWRKLLISVTAIAVSMAAAAVVL